MLRKEAPRVLVHTHVVRIESNRTRWSLSSPSEAWPWTVLGAMAKATAHRGRVTHDATSGALAVQFLRPFSRRWLEPWRRILSCAGAGRKPAFHDGLQAIDSTRGDHH